MSNNASANNSLAAAFTGQMEKDFAKHISALVDWAEFAAGMETQNGVSKVSARMEYELQNECNGLWAALYGNTTDTSFIPDRNTELDQRTRFCARLNVQYWETRRNDYRAKNPHVDKKAPEYSSTEAANDMEWCNIVVSLQEAILNYNRLVTKFAMIRNQYELITGKAYEYIPYKIQPKSTANKANAKLAAALLDAA